MYQVTTALRKLSKLDKRIHGAQGGTSASKTISIIQLLIDKCQRDTEPRLSSITSESMPHLKRGAIRDFKDIMMSHHYWNENRWNASDFVYTFETGTPLEFFSLDMPHKVRGPRRKRLFINEANNIPYETFDQLEVRTEHEIWLDWNPVAEFWWHDIEGNGGKGVRDRVDADELILTYKDNEGLPQSIVRSIETHKDDENWWRVYGMGLLGEAQGRIYTGWEIIDDVPPEARLERRGLDFGYSNDPAAIVDVYWWNGGYILDEITYQTGLKNNELAKIIQGHAETVVIADSAEPKSIDEIAGYGISIIPAFKGKDSVKYGIQFLQQQKIRITKRSVNGIKEYRKYFWMTDKNGKYINTPVDIWNHFLDAARYAITDHQGLFEEEKQKPVWSGKVPGTYIPPAIQTEDTNDWTSTGGGETWE